METKKKSVFVAFIIFCLFYSNVFTQKQIQWRGENRTGFYPSKSLMQEWPPMGPPMILHVENLPEGYSSVVMKDNVMYVTGIEDTAEYLTAINYDGSIKWKSLYGKAWFKSYTPARCTPTIEGEYAYVISGAGYLACIELATGIVKWNFDGYGKFKGSWNKWGVAESPLIIDDKMIYTPAGDQTTMVAINKSNGETIWKSESLKDMGSFCSPAYAEIDGTKLIVSATYSYVFGVDAATGKILWKFNYLDEDKPMMGGDINPITPIIIGKEIFVTSGYNHVGILLKMAEDLQSVSLKWKTEDLDTHHGGVVVIDGYIYGSNYTTIRSGNWVCIDWNTGELKYEQEWFGKGSVITSGGFLICYYERKGNIALVKATPEKFDLISEFIIDKGTGPHWAHPTIFNDKLFIRHGKDVMVYEIGTN